MENKSLSIPENLIVLSLCAKDWKCGAFTAKISADTGCIEINRYKTKKKNMPVRPTEKKNLIMSLGLKSGLSSRL